MNHPLDNLRSDHALVARVCGALVGIAESVHQGTPFPAADAALILRFLRDFVIPVHMHKESTWLWPAIAMRGDDAAAGAVGDVARLHEEAIELIHSLILFWEPGDLSAPEREGFLAASRALRDRLARMTRIEEDTLFPACDETVPADDLLEWVEQFARLEAERGRSTTWRPALTAVLSHWG